MWRNCNPCVHWWENKMYKSAVAVENSMTVPQTYEKKKKKELLCDPAIPLLLINPGELEAESGGGICIPMSKAALFITQVSTDREWVTIVYTYNGVVSSLKKEGNSDTGYNKAKP